MEHIRTENNYRDNLLINSCITKIKLFTYRFFKASEICINDGLLEPKAVMQNNKGYIV